MRSAPTEAAAETGWTFEPGRPIPGASKWLTEHWDEYAGLWVAVGANGLVGAADTLDELEAKIGSLHGVLISHVV